MENIFLLLIIICAMLSHIVSLFGGLVIVKKYEEFFKDLNFPCVFDVNNFYAHRFWFSLLTIIVSFGLFISSAGLLVDILNNTQPFVVFKYSIINLMVGVLIFQFNYYILRDRRNIKKQEK